MERFAGKRSSIKRAAGIGLPLTVKETFIVIRVLTLDIPVLDQREDQQPGNSEQDKAHDNNNRQISVSLHGKPLSANPLFAATRQAAIYCRNLCEGMKNG